MRLIPRPASSISRPGTTWGQIASHLLQVEGSGLWRKTQPSFSAWLEIYARENERTLSNLWRLLAAGRYYQHLHRQFSREGVAFPALEDTDVAASPESLEILRKIDRIAQEDLLPDIQLQAMRGAIPRRELRNLWDTYRPMMEGRTARGRGVLAPRFNPRDAQMRRHRSEADCITPLIQSGPAWLGLDKASHYKIVHVPKGGEARNLLPLPDALFLVAADKQSRLVIHGVEATLNAASNRFLASYRKCGTYVDYVWLARPGTSGNRVPTSLPREVGILASGASGVTVVRPASPAQQASTGEEEFLRILLQATSRNT